MYTLSSGLPRRRLLVILAVSLILPLVLATNGVSGVSKAASVSQTPNPSPTPSSTPSKPILLTDPVPDPQKEGVIYFSQTGHTLRGQFLSYWQQNGGLAQFGYPLTEEFFEPDGADNAPLQVQYFERNRFELHPENQAPYDVLLGTLGREFHTQDPPAPQLPAPALYFPETGHNLSDVFLQYWQTHGGLAVNGYPITEPAMEASTDGKEYLTQWFERSRFELHPENAGSPYEVLLGQLGRQLSEKRGYPYGWYPPYGRAIDYSWLAGDLVFYGPTDTARPEAGCAIFSYERGGTSVQLSRLLGYPFGYVASIFVVFGHPALPNETFRQCPVEPAAGYIVEHEQDNPAR